MSLPGCDFSEDLLDCVSAQDDRVIPAGFGHGRRDHVLAHPVEVVGHAGGIVGLLRPVAAEVLERLTAEQQRIGLSVLVMRLREQIVVLTLRVKPVVEHLDRPVQRDVLGDHEFSHMSTDITVAADSSVLAE